MPSVRILTTVTLFSISLFIAGCAAVHEKPAASQTSKKIASSDCKTILGLDSIYQKNIILFGELHGTNEIPRMFGNVACNAIVSQPSKRILIGLELPGDFDRAFLKIGKVPETQILSEVDRMDFWRAMKDGRHSRAMRELTLRLISYAHTSGGRVFLIAFERPNIDSIGAAAILSRIEEVHADQTLILVGNNHARKVRMPNGPAYPPMGENLGRGGESIVSLDGRFEAGRAWICMSQCAARPISSPLHIGRDGEFVELMPGIAGYDGIFHLSQLTVSDAENGPIN